MLDKAVQSALRPVLHRMGAALVRRGVGADAVTLAGFVTGMAAAVAIGLQHALTGLVLLLLSRLLDGLDGAVARATHPPARGGVRGLTRAGRVSDTALPGKSFYFLGGLTEATETIATFALMCLCPTWFPALAYGFAALCMITTALRIGWGWQRLG